MEIKLREKHLLTKKSLYAYAAPGVIIRIDRDLLLLLLFKQFCNSNIYMLSLSSIFPKEITQQGIYNKSMQNGHHERCNF